MRVSIVLPTYDERDNIVPLVQRILAVLPAAEVIVVDDDSPDGTGDVVEAAGLPGVVLVRRDRDPGLRASLAEGARKATGDVVVFMDADGSHPPEVIPDLLARVEGSDDRPGVDLAVASRFVSGASDGRGAGAASLSSRLINGLARALLDRRLTDWTGGFSAIRRFRLDQFGLSGHYGEYFIDLAFQVLRSGARVSELPFVYVPRTHGRSKTATSLLGLLRRGGPYVRMILRLAVLDQTIPKDRRRPSR